MQTNIKPFPLDEKGQTKKDDEKLTKQSINGNVAELELSIDCQLTALADIIANKLLKELLNEQSK